MSRAWKPENYNSVSPYLLVTKVEPVISFLEHVFGCERLRRTDDPSGRVRHAEVRVQDTVVMMGEATDGWPPAPAHLHVYVPDVDDTFERARAAGAEVIQEPSEAGDGDRRGGFKDPAGNSWWVASQQG